MTNISAPVLEGLRAVYDKRGVLTAEVVVEEARDRNHPLHDRFEWNNTRAANKYRLVQARELLRVAFRPDPEAATTLRAFVSIKGEETPHATWVPTEEALADPISRAILLRQMERDWETFRRRYQHMQEFSALIQAEASRVGVSA